MARKKHMQINNLGSNNPAGDEIIPAVPFNQNGKLPPAEASPVEEDNDHGCPDRCLLGPFNVDMPTPLD